jgi:hypothetical protein
VQIAGQPFTVRQDAAVSCTYEIKPTYYNAGRGPDDISISVTAGPGCTWDTINSASWVTVAEGAHGSGNGTVRLLVQPNDEKKARTATILIAGQTFTLHQAGRD